MPSHSFPRNVVAVAVVALAFSALPALGAAPAASRSGIAWQVASSDAEVDRAFAVARKEGKPVFLYWGAVWCPPCNQVKATLFSRPDFAERTRAFVPVYVDGDKPGAQKVASRFKVSGYPTMILFKSDGTELTRLPGEVDPERYLQALNAGLDAQVPVKDLVAKAVARQPLTPQQWRMLAFYSWDTDEQQVLPAAEVSQRLSEMAAAVPAELAAVRDRLAFKAVALRATSGTSSPEAMRQADLVAVERLISVAAPVRETADLLIGYAEPVVKYLAPSAASTQALASKWDASVARLLEAGELSKSEQADAWDARVALWKSIDATDKLSTERKRLVQGEVARLAGSTTDRYERQAVIPSVAHVLRQADLLDESDALLKSELARAVAPYYHMLGLAGNARKRGDANAALQWYEQAWLKSEGPATKVQWGTGYVGQIMDLAPTDVGRTVKATTAVLSALEARPETFYGRSQRSLERMAKRLSEWAAKDPSRAGVVEKAKSQLAVTCNKLPAKDAGRTNCERVFGSAA